MDVDAVGRENLECDVKDSDALVVGERRELARCPRRKKCVNALVSKPFQVSADLGLG
jgi:hypothetical protein